MVNTEDKHTIIIDTTNARFNLDAFIKKLETASGGVAVLKSSFYNAATGVRQYTAEINNATKATKDLQKIIGKTKTPKTNVKIRTTAGTPKPPIQPLPMPSHWGDISNFANYKPSTKPIPALPQPTTMPPYAPATYPTPIAENGITPALNNLFPISEKIATESLRNRQNIPELNKNTLGGLKDAFAKSANSDLEVSKKRQKQEQKQISLFTKFGNGMKNLTKQTFMLQMGMLGVSFSSQALMSSLQGLGMQAITGLADTEGMIRNLVLSDALGGTNLMEGLNFDKLVEDSLKAQGALAGLSSILVLIADKVFADPDTANKIANAIVLVVQKLTSEEFIKAILGIVDAITKEGFIESLTNAAQKIADLVNWLGEKGLLDKVLLLIIACQFLMPVLAALQLLLLALGSFYFAALIAVLIIVGSVIWAISSSMEDFGKSGNILLDVFNVIYSSFVKLWELLLYIPRSVFDVISSMITELSGGLIKLENPFATFTNTLWKLKDLANTTFGGGNSDYQYDTGSHQYVQINNFNKSVGSKDAEEVLAVMRDKKSRGLDWS